jgi:hypothetical protein
MISLPIEQVSNTKIFVGLNSTKTYQLTVYSNFVSNNSNGNAMVIPVPFPSTVKFHDLSQIKNFFKSVDQSFYKQSQTLGWTNSFSSDRIKGSKSDLEVFSVGSYKVSLASNLQDISRLNKDIFVLSPGLAKTLESHYSNLVWGFIVFVLARDKKDYHPFAFSHALYNNKIYIPTRHYHDSLNTNNDGYMERIGGLDTRSNPYEDQFDKKESAIWNGNQKSINDASMADDWSHNIYLFNCGNSASKSQLLQSMLNPEYRYAWDQNLYWNRRLIDFDLDTCDGFEKYHIEGIHPNLDIMLPVC